MRRRSPIRLRTFGTLAVLVLVLPACGSGAPADKSRFDAGTAAKQRPISSGPDSRLLSPADRASFKRLAETLPGTEGIALATVGRSPTVASAGALHGGVAWSTAKVPVAMAAVNAGISPDDVERAITASDNAAADKLWSALGDNGQAAVASTRQLRAAGDQVTEIPSRRVRPAYTAFGQTAWSLRDQVRFAAGMACTGAGLSVLEHMGRITSAQRWGLGSTGVAAEFKGGWGPGVTPGNDDGWLERQFGILTFDAGKIAVAIATTASDHDAATRSLTEIARWLTSRLRQSGVAGRPLCRP